MLWLVELRSLDQVVQSGSHCLTWARTRSASPQKTAALSAAVLPLLGSNQDPPDPESSRPGRHFGQLVGNRPLSEHRCRIPGVACPLVSGETTAKLRQCSPGLDGRACPPPARSGTCGGRWPWIRSHRSSVMQLGVMFWHARQYDSAVTQYRRTRERDSPTTRLPPALSRTEGHAELAGARISPPPGSDVEVGLFLGPLQRPNA